MPVMLMERKGPTAWMRDHDGKRVTTHSPELAECIAESSEARTIELTLVEGEIRIAGQKLDEDGDERQ